jgi:addiction module HigA family antidote
MEKKFGDPIHPGEILADELEEIGMSAATLAEKLDVPKNRIYQIINEQRSITADTAMRLSIFFGTTAEFWLNLQKSYELDVARQNTDNFKHIRPYEPPTPKAVQCGLLPTWKQQTSFSIFIALGKGERAENKLLENRKLLGFIKKNTRPIGVISSCCKIER